jgi:hypothetical protein
VETFGSSVCACAEPATAHITPNAINVLMVMFLVGIPFLMQRLAFKNVRRTLHIVQWASSGALSFIM